MNLGFAWLYFGLVMNLCIEKTLEDVFASSSHLRILASGEGNIRLALRHYIYEEKRRLEFLESLYKEVKRVYSSESGEMEIRSVYENPLNAFRLIKRFTTTWKEVWKTASDFSAFRDFESALGALHDFIPNDEDIKGSQLSLLRLQMTYDLSIKDLLEGQVAGRQSLPLSQREAFETGLVGLENGKPDAALEWLEKAKSHGVPPFVSPVETFAAIATAYAMKGDYLKATDNIREVIVRDPSNPDHLRRILPLLTDNRPKPDPGHESAKSTYLRLCRQGAFGTNSSYGAQDSKRLSCYLQRSKHSPFLRFKVEPICSGPSRVRLIHDFLNDRESMRLRSSSVHLISRAKVGNTLESYVSDMRVGKIAWLQDESPDPLILRISRRISDATGLNTTNPTGEHLQTSNYGMGGHYEPHYDHDHNRYNYPEDNLPPEIADNGDRIATFMIYLNDVEAGGATVFPRLNLWTRPVKNAAIFWYNYKPSGDVDPDTLHAGCPVLLGEKWVANKWIREYGQEFYRRCGLTRDSS